MNEAYFDEKKQMALQAIDEAVAQATAARILIATTNYAMPDLVNQQHVHATLTQASGLLGAARRDFEKTRWAAAATGLSFEDWLRDADCADLTY